MSRVPLTQLKTHLAPAEAPMARPRPLPAPDAARARFALPQQDQPKKQPRSPEPRSAGEEVAEDAPDLAPEPLPAPPEELAAFAAPLRLPRYALPAEDEAEPNAPAEPEEKERECEAESPEAAIDLACDMPAGDMDLMVQAMDPDPEQSPRKQLAESWSWLAAARSGESLYRSAMRHRRRRQRRGRRDA